LNTTATKPQKNELFIAILLYFFNKSYF